MVHSISCSCSTSHNESSSQGYDWNWHHWDHGEAIGGDQEKYYIHTDTYSYCHQQNHYINLFYGCHESCATETNVAYLWPLPATCPALEEIAPWLVPQVPTYLLNNCYPPILLSEHRSDPFPLLQSRSTQSAAPGCGCSSPQAVPISSYSNDSLETLSSSFILDRDPTDSISSRRMLDDSDLQSQLATSHTTSLPSALLISPKAITVHSTSRNSSKSKSTPETSRVLQRREVRFGSEALSARRVYPVCPRSANYERYRLVCDEICDIVRSTVVQGRPKERCKEVDETRKPNFDAIPSCELLRVSATWDGLRASPSSVYSQAPGATGTAFPYFFTNNAPRNGMLDFSVLTGVPPESLSGSQSAFAHARSQSPATIRCFDSLPTLDSEGVFPDLGGPKGPYGLVEASSTIPLPSLLPANRITEPASRSSSVWALLIRSAAQFDAPRECRQNMRNRVSVGGFKASLRSPSPGISSPRATDISEGLASAPPIGCAVSSDTPIPEVGGHRIRERRTRRSSINADNASDRITRQATSRHRTIRGSRLKSKQRHFTRSLANSEGKHPSNARVSTHGDRHPDGPRNAYEELQTKNPRVPRKPSLSKRIFEGSVLLCPDSKRIKSIPVSGSNTAPYPCAKSRIHFLPRDTPVATLLGTDTNAPSRPHPGLFAYFGRRIDPVCPTQMKVTDPADMSPSSQSSPRTKRRSIVFAAQAISDCHNVDARGTTIEDSHANNGISSDDDDVRLTQNNLLHPKIKFNVLTDTEALSTEMDDNGLLLIMPFSAAEEVLTPAVFPGQAVLPGDRRNSEDPRITRARKIELATKARVAEIEVPGFVGKSQTDLVKMIRSCRRV